jgi:hypothetical protein
MNEQARTRFPMAGVVFIALLSASTAMAQRTAVRGISSNTATDSQALASFVSGETNTATGFGVLELFISGDANTADGAFALQQLTSGSDNVAVGFDAMRLLDTGDQNIAVGRDALINVTRGDDNIALGSNTGTNLTLGHDNIYIGSNAGNVGAPTESATTRIGSAQRATFIDGIFGSPVEGPGDASEDVVVTVNGQLGFMPSSARYKRDINDMDAASSNLMKLRPVTFRYKADPAGTLQYGLVAEEVEKLYPELVTHGADGQVQSVRYGMMTGMLINELQKQARQNHRLAAQVGKLSAQIIAMKASTGRELAAVQERLATMERVMQAQNGSQKLAAVFNK